MRLTIFISSISGGGAERVACSLANHMAEQGHEVSMLTMSETPNIYGLTENVRTESLLREGERSNKLGDNIRRYFRLRRYVRSHAEDAYVVLLPVPICLLLHFAGGIKGPVIASERNDPKQYSKLQQFLLRHYAARADCWVFQTEEAAHWYGDLVKKFRIIPNAVSREFFGEREPVGKTAETPMNLALNIEKSVDRQELLILAAGRLNGQKNYPLLIDAFDEVHRKHPECRLVIYGKGPLEKELKAYAGRKECSPYVEFGGYVANLPERLRQAQIYVLSSDYEGMPNSLLEAMAMGLPCVSTDCPCGGPRSLITDRENGILVPVNDRKRMAAALNELIENEKLRTLVGMRAKAVLETHSPDEIYGKWNALILEETQE